MKGARKRLIAHLISMEAVPSGGGLFDGVRFLLDKNRVTETARKAERTADDMIAAVRQSRDADPTWTDDYICQRILEGVERAQARLRP